MAVNPETSIDMGGKRKAKLPFIVWSVLGFTLLAAIGNFTILGFRMAGLSWFIPLMIAILLLIRRSGLVTFPIWIWLPWVALLILNLTLIDSSVLDSRVSPLQRTIQLLTPLFVAMAVSTYRPTTEVLDHMTSAMEKFAYLLFAGSVLSSLTAILARHPAALAAQSICAILVGVFFINRYLIHRKLRDFRMYMLMVALPVLAITRTAMAVILMATPISLGPIPLRRRLLIIILAMGVGLWAFYLPEVQSKMFFSGQGEISDMRFDNPDFATSGRSYMWAKMYEEAVNNHWFGHGTGSAETASYTFSELGYPHNDWLLTYFDYGVIGILIYLVCNIAMLLHCWRASKMANNDNTRLYFFAGASTIIPFMLVMFTDNIMVYSSFFGNLQYAIIGLAYGALHGEKRVI